MANLSNASANAAAALAPTIRPLLLLLGIAAAVAVGVTVVLWWQGPDWSLLYGNLSDRDAANVVQALQSAGIDYKLDDSTGAIMVPAGRVRNARLRLAEQGLPASSASSLELLTKDSGFGESQLMQNARYQYALENELANTISALQPVRAARVTLALPQQSAFVSQRRPASASVLVELQPGRELNPGQVSAIVHLVASSVPGLDSGHVTVVDQDGLLLSAPKSGAAAIEAAQFQAARRIDHVYARRIEQLISPMVGPGRVRAEVTVDLSSGAREQASEKYQPNSAVVRSEQQSQQTTRSGGAAEGIPGSLSNQPPAGGTAVAVNASPQASTVKKASGTAAVAAAGVPISTSTQSTRNYEINRTLSYLRQPAGQIKRVTVAVLVDDLHKVGAGGKLAERPLSAAQLSDITQLVKNAVGFDAARGDSVSVVNAAFLRHSAVLKPQSIPLWQQPWVQRLERLLGGALVLVVLALGVLRPLINGLLRPTARAANLPALAPAEAVAEGPLSAPAPAAARPLAYEQQVVQARTLVTQDPKRVAQVVRSWVGE